VSVITFYESRRKFILKTLLFSVIAWMILSTLVTNFNKSHRIGLDLNDIRCLPWRAYFITYGSGPFERGQYVAFQSINGLMGPKFEGRLIGKQVAAIPGDHIVVKNDMLSINNKQIGPLTLIDRLRVPHGYFDRDEIVPAGKLLVLGTEPRSYDGRYWGFLDQQSVVGWVKPFF
jgi:conjugal transfer pilin signal peptidase TrbI